MSDSDPKTIQSRFATMNVKISRRQANKIGRSMARKQGEAQAQEAYDELDRVHAEIDQTIAKAPENPGLVTGEKLARDDEANSTARPGKNGNIPPVSGRFKPGQSGNPSGRPPAKMSRLVCALLSHNELELAKKVVKSWVDQACNGRQSALVELLKRADGLQPSKAVREDLFYNLPPGSMARTRKRTAKAFRDLPPLWSAEEEE